MSRSLNSCNQTAGKLKQSGQRPLPQGRVTPQTVCRTPLKRLGSRRAERQAASGKTSR